MPLLKYLDVPPWNEIKYIFSEAIECKGSERDKIDMIPDQLWYYMFDRGFRSAPMFLGEFNFDPVIAAEKGLTSGQSFLYDRSLGLFEIDYGMHPSSMSFLYYLKHYPQDGTEAEKEAWEREERLSSNQDFAEMYITETEGTFYKSSVGRKIIVGKMSNISNFEKRFIESTGYEIISMEFD